MGYSASAHLIIGVRLSNLVTDVHTKTEDVPLYDQLSGEPNGKTRRIDRKYATVPNGIVYEIGNNANIAGRMVLNLSGIAPEDKTYNIEVHLPDHESMNLSTMIYGIDLDSSTDADVKLVDMNLVEIAKEKLKSYFETKYAYTDGIQIFTLLKHSY